LNNRKHLNKFDINKIYFRAETKIKSSRIETETNYIQIKKITFKFQNRNTIFKIIKWSEIIKKSLSNKTKRSNKIKASLRGDKMRL